MTVPGLKKDCFVSHISLRLSLAPHRAFNRSLHQFTFLSQYKSLSIYLTYLTSVSINTSPKMKFATVFTVAIILDAAVVSEANLRGNGRAPPQSRGLKENKKGKDKGKAKDKGGNNPAPPNFGAPQITQTTNGENGAWRPGTFSVAQEGQPRPQIGVRASADSGDGVATLANGTKVLMNPHNGIYEEAKIPVGTNFADTSPQENAVPIVNPAPSVAQPAPAVAQPAPVVEQQAPAVEQPVPATPTNSNVGPDGAADAADAIPESQVGPDGAADTTVQDWLMSEIERINAENAEERIANNPEAAILRDPSTSTVKVPTVPAVASTPAAPSTPVATTVNVNIGADHPANWDVAPTTCIKANKPDWDWGDDSSFDVEQMYARVPQCLWDEHCASGCCVRFHSGFKICQDPTTMAEDMLKWCSGSCDNLVTTITINNVDEPAV